MTRMEKLRDELAQRHAALLAEADKLIQEANDVEEQMTEIDRFLQYKFEQEQ